MICLYFQINPILSPIRFMLVPVLEPDMVLEINEWITIVPTLLFWSCFQWMKFIIKIYAFSKFNISRVFQNS